MKKYIPIALFIGICQILFSQVTDINDKIYRTTLIGSKIWMSENLDVDKFQNGDIIPQAKSASEWNAYSDAEEPAWCYLKYNLNNGTKYGKLYNWYAVNDPRGLAPKGFHIPSSQDWDDLINYLGGKTIAGAKMKSLSGWFEDGNGTNSSGFSGLPSGYLLFGSSFVEEYGAWWSSTEWIYDTGAHSGACFSIFLSYQNGSCEVSRGHLKSEGLAVRCVKD